MYIVGTSGHIDHGKTSLIKALTNIDCDRLPEEKSREMTIDIGFASIEYPKFGSVSIIDVPGHERFIRNMVVGAWGIDLALLVVAVDDGWMPQTEDHFRVLSLLGIERIIVVLNKIDAADEEMIAFVAEEVRGELESSPYAGSDIVRVSAKSCQGIEELKEVILKNLKLLSRASDARKPYLFIDRVFGSKGYGTVVTGTLKNGTFKEDDSVLLLPHNRESRIKKIESHHEALPQGVPSQRTALNIAGVSIEELHRGHIVVKRNFFTRSGEIIAKIELLENKKEIRNNTGIELLIGATSLKGKLILIRETPGGELSFCARVKFAEPWYFYPGEPFILTNPGGFRIIGGGRVVLPDYDSIPKKRLVKSSIGLLEKYTREEIINFIITVNQYIPESMLFSMFPESEKTIEAAVSALVETKKSVRLGGFIVERAFYDEALASVAAVIAANIGLNIREISDYSGIKPEFCQALIPLIMQEHRVIEKEGRYFSGDSITPENLPEDRKEILGRIRDRGIEGAELDKMDDDASRKGARDLLRLGFLVSLDGNIILEKTVYEDLKSKVMALFSGRDKITIPEAKDATGLSRKFIIPLLNRIESDGLIKRIGDFRIKA